MQAIVEHTRSDLNQFVGWFRRVTPYINSFRGKVFVIGFGGQAVTREHLKTFAYDINLLASLGIRLVLVHGADPQIAEELNEKNLQEHNHHGYRVTDEKILDCIIDAIGSVYIEIESQLSQGLPNTPMANSRIRVVGGNFVTARPIGVIDGIDLHYAGLVRRVDAEGLQAQLNLGNIVLLSCQGSSLTGETFSLLMEDIAESVAVALGANKLIYMIDADGITSTNGELFDVLTTDKAESFIASDWLSEETQRCLRHAIKASRNGIKRIQLINYQNDGALLQELFTQDGVGTLITRESIELIREATIEDITKLMSIISPLENDGTLVQRPRERLESEIEQFSVLESDGLIVGCAALYLYDNNVAELACLAVQPEQRHWGYGERLMQRIEQRAKEAGAKRLIVLTTRTEHWFVERGFKLCSLSELPSQKREMYNYKRNSKALIKLLNKNSI